jgi:hypothetical protein
VSNRIFPTWRTWGPDPSFPGGYVLAFVPHTEYPSKNEIAWLDKVLERNAGDCEKGKLRGFYRITPLAPDVCRVTLMTKIHGGGHASIGLTNFAGAIDTVKQMETKVCLTSSPLPLPPPLTPPQPPLPHSLTPNSS